MNKIWDEALTALCGRLVHAFWPLAFCQNDGTAFNLSPAAMI
jgi:hypothetical protein